VTNETHEGLRTAVSHVQANNQAIIANLLLIEFTPALLLILNIVSGTIPSCVGQQWKFILFTLYRCNNM
jgi:hypothetical protein